MIIMPRTGLGSAMSASRTTAWYQSGKVERLPVTRLVLSALCIGIDSRNERLVWLGGSLFARLLYVARSGDAGGSADVAPRERVQVHQVETDHQPQSREDDRRDPGGGDELLLELGIDRRAGIAAVVGQARIGAADGAERQHREQNGPPDGQV